MDARSIIADSMEEALRIGGGYRFDDIERHARKLEKEMREQRAKSFESGRRVGYSAGLEDGRKLTKNERDAIYYAGFAEGAGLASKRKGN